MQTICARAHSYISPISTRHGSISLTIYVRWSLMIVPITASVCSFISDDKHIKVHINITLVELHSKKSGQVCPTLLVLQIMSAATHSEYHDCNIIHKKQKTQRYCECEDIIACPFFQTGLTEIVWNAKATWPTLSQHEHEWLLQRGQDSTGNTKSFGKPFWFLRFYQLSDDEDSISSINDQQFSWMTGIDHRENWSLSKILIQKITKINLISSSVETKTYRRSIALGFEFIC